MKFTKTVTLIASSAFSWQGCYSDAGRTPFYVAAKEDFHHAKHNSGIFKFTGDASLIEGRGEELTGADMLSWKTVVPNENIDKIRSISHRLRGGADHGELVAEVKQIMQEQHDSVESLLMMHHNGDDESLALHMKSHIEGVGDKFEAGSDSPTKSSNVTRTNHSLIAGTTFENIPYSQIVKFFDSQLFTDLKAQLNDSITILENVKSILDHPVKKSRQLKANLFSDAIQHLNEPLFAGKHKLESESGNGLGQFIGIEGNTWHVNSYENIQKFLFQGRERKPLHLPDISKWIHGDDAASETRRLEVDERHKRRLQSIEVCEHRQCTSDGTCDCERLKGCIDDMSDYDLGLLFIRGNIETDLQNDKFGHMKKDMFLFDADFNIVQKISRIRELVRKSDCTNLLPELHSPCSPLQESCDGQKSQSFQLSIDDVCDAVHTTTKLLFSNISLELDGSWGNDGVKSSITMCGTNQRLALSACKDFITGFDLLYEGRDTKKYPDWNPLRVFPLLLGENYNFITFPTRYRFRQNVHGVDMISSLFDKISVRSGLNKCMVAINNQVQMSTCRPGNQNQDFYYNATTQEIKLKGKQNYCLNYNFNDKTVYMRICQGDRNQKWYYDVITEELRTFWDSSCLDWSKDDKPIMNSNCNGVDSQKFVVPSYWLPAIAVNRVRAFSNPKMCIEAGSDKQLRMKSCDPNQSMQDFMYDPLTRQIKQGTHCMDCSSKNIVYMYPCHSGINQMWYLDLPSNSLRNGRNNKCVQWTGTNMEMVSCVFNSKSQQHDFPVPWLESLSTSSFDEVRLFSNLDLCMTFQRPSSVTMSTCLVSNINQRLYFDYGTLRIKLGDTGKCLDYNFSNGDVYSNDCHGDNNQKWFHSRFTNHIKSLYIDKCLSFDSDTLKMEVCDDGKDSRKFLVPSSWAQSTRGVRSLLDYTKCLAYDMDQGNNVVLRECNSEGELVQEFQYDSTSETIMYDFLCMQTSKQGNVFMSVCDQELEQRWFYDEFSDQIKSYSKDCNSSSGCCLYAKVDKNVVLGKCSGNEKNHKFIIPHHWESRRSQLERNSLYKSSYISPAIWSDRPCHVDMLQNVVQTCDDTMSLLLGKSTSLGTLLKIAKLIEAKNHTRMPGTCCLDNPLMSSRFGHHYDQTTMSCQNPGPWHLGITEEACENANGRWVRSPCVTLKECIDARPQNGTDHFSKSFEDFAKELVINSANNEERCGEVRVKLGFQSDHPFDTEVCQAFESLMCDKFFTNIDHAVGNLTMPNYKSIPFVEVKFEKDNDLPFEMLPERSGGFQIPQLGTKASLNNLQFAAIMLKHSKFVIDELWEFITNSPFCEAIVLGKEVCFGIKIVYVKVLYGIKLATTLAYDLANSVYEKQTLSPSDIVDQELRIRALLENLKASDSWNTKALGILNKNIYTQHTEMRDQLQIKHQLLINDITKKTKADIDNLATTLKGQHDFLEKQHDAITTSLNDLKQKLTASKENYLISSANNATEEQVPPSGEKIEKLGKMLESHYELLQGQQMAITSSLADIKDHLVQSNTILNNALSFHSKSAAFANSVQLHEVSDMHKSTLDGQVPKIYCGFDLPFANGTQMELAKGGNATLYVKEDLSESAVPIPLVLSVQPFSFFNVPFQVKVRSNSAIVGDRKPVMVLYKSSSHQMSLYVLPRTCSCLNFEVCNQSGEDFVLYEFTFVTLDESGVQNDPAICNVVIYSSIAVPSIASSNVRYDLLPVMTFPVAPL